jgi:hypothetical protein
VILICDCLINLKGKAGLFACFVKVKKTKYRKTKYRTILSFGKMKFGKSVIAIFARKMEEEERENKAAAPPDPPFQHQFSSFFSTEADPNSKLRKNPPIILVSRELKSIYGYGSCGPQMILASRYRHFVHML